MLNRREVLGASISSLLPTGAFAQLAADPSATWPIDGGRWCATPDFTPLVAGVTSPLKVVSGWRPERRVGAQARVRLEAIPEQGSPTIIHNYGHCGAGVTLSLGCASLVEQWITNSGTVSKNSPITVVGAGIIGLTTAYVLKRRGYSNVTIFARVLASGDFDNATTVSDIAGGQFEAAGIDDISGNIAQGASPEIRLRSILKETLNVLTEQRGEASDPFLVHGFSNRYVYTVVRNYTNKFMTIPRGLDQASEVVMLNDKLRQLLVQQYGPLALAEPNAEGVVAPFRDLQKARIAPVRFGVRNTVLINTANLIANIRRYLNSLETGPRTSRKIGPQYTVRSFSDLQSIQSDVVINCSGLGGAVIGGPDAGASMVGRYGLLAKLPKNPGFQGEAPRYLYSGFGYMFPRSDGTIVGGAWDGNAPYALSSANIDTIANKSSADQEVYFNALRPITLDDLNRSKKMVKAVGYFFLGRNADLNPLQSELEWMSGYSQFACATDPTGCHL